MGLSNKFCNHTCVMLPFWYIYIQRLKHQTPRQVDLNFEELIEKFKERQQLHEARVMKDRQRQAEK